MDSLSWTQLGLCSVSLQCYKDVFKKLFWKYILLQSFAPLPQECLEKINDLDRGGIVFLREGATTVSEDQGQVDRMIIRCTWDYQLPYVCLCSADLYLALLSHTTWGRSLNISILHESKHGADILIRTWLCHWNYDKGSPVWLNTCNVNWAAMSS